MKGFCLWNIATTLVVGGAVIALSPVFNLGIANPMLAALCGVGFMFIAMLMVIEDSVDLDFGDVILIIGAAGIGGVLMSPLILVETYWIGTVAFIWLLTIAGVLHAGDRHASPWWTRPSTSCSISLAWMAAAWQWSTNGRALASRSSLRASAPWPRSCGSRSRRRSARASAACRTVCEMDSHQRTLKQTPSHTWEGVSCCATNDLTNCGLLCECTLVPLQRTHHSGPIV